MGQRTGALAWVVVVVTMMTATTPAAAGERGARVDNDPAGIDWPDEGAADAEE